MRIQSFLYNQFFRLSNVTYQMYLDDEDGEINCLEVYDAAEIGNERMVYT